MKSSSRILLELLSKSIVLEEKPPKPPGPPPGPPPEEKPKEEKERDSDYQDSASMTVIERPTSNRLGLGRPPKNVQDSREMAADPTRAKELLQTLGAKISGGNWTEMIMSLYTTAAGHADFGQVVKSSEIVHNRDRSKNGVAVNLSGEFNKDEKQIYFFVRSLYSAAINSGQLGISDKENKKMKLEQTDGQPQLVFYQGKKAMSFNGE